MADAENHADLNRLLSGELPEADAVELMSRLLQDDELRLQYQRLLAVDRIVREACQGDESKAQASQAEADMTNDDMMSPDRREEQIQAILSEIRRRSRTQRGASRGQAVRRILARPVLAWGIAAALAIVCGLLAYLACGVGTVPADHVHRMDAALVAHYSDVRRQLGEDSMAVIWTTDGVSEVGDLGAAHSPGKAEAIVRVTVVRTGDGVAEQWRGDALIRQGHVIELATQADRSWPASIRVGVRPGEAGCTVISLQARLAENPPAEITNQGLTVSPLEPVSVGSVMSGPWRYEVFVEASPARAASAV